MAEDILKLEGAEPIITRINDMSRVISEPSKLLAGIGGIMKGRLAETFRIGRDPVSLTPWKKTSAFTLSLRAGGGSGGQTMVDHPSSGLLGSLMAAIPKVNGNTVSITTNKKYARIHDEGGLITPTKAKYLAIPLLRKAKLAAERAGGVRKWFEANKTNGVRVVAFLAGGLFIAGPNRTEKGKAVGKLELWFVLKKSVTIPQRRFMALGTADLFTIENFVGDYLVRIWNSAQEIAL